LFFDEKLFRPTFFLLIFLSLMMSKKYVFAGVEIVDYFSSFSLNLEFKSNFSRLFKFYLLKNKKPFDEFLAYQYFTPN